MSTVTYRRAGVHLDAAGHFVRDIKKLAQSTAVPGVVNRIGGFASLFDLGRNHGRRPLIVSSTDGVGTKLEVACLRNQHDTVGIDLVAMCVNDIVTCGAQPLFFLDYVAIGKFNAVRLRMILRGITAGCRLAGCALVGGETAEMPGLYARGRYDLAGFSVGAVPRSHVIDGKKTRQGDLVLGLLSSGIHSNGFSLIRRIFTEKELRSAVGKKLLTPTRIYVKPVLALLRRVEVKAMAHITGGGFYENIPRVLPKHLGVRIDTSLWLVPPVFSEIQKRAGLKIQKMFGIFNMGIGMILVVSPRNAERTCAFLKRFKVETHIIGQVIAGGGVRIQ